jgi:hypothetical protein
MARPLKADHFRKGSKPEMPTPKRHFRFAPINGHQAMPRALVRVAPRGETAEAFVTLFMIEAVPLAALPRPARTSEACVPRPISNAAATICIESSLWQEN